MVVYADNLVRKRLLADKGMAEKNENVKGIREVVVGVGRDERLNAVVLQTVGEKSYHGFFDGPSPALSCNALGRSPFSTRLDRTPAPTSRSRALCTLWILEKLGPFPMVPVSDASGPPFRSFDMSPSANGG